MKFEESGYSAQTRISYIDLPLLLRVKADGLFFEAGPQAGFLIGQKTEETISGLGSRSSTSAQSAAPTVTLVVTDKLLLDDQ